MSIARRLGLGAMVAAILVCALAGGCSAKTYRTASGYSASTFVGSYTKDKAGLAQVRRVALIAFTAKNYGSGLGEDLAPIVTKAFDEFTMVFEGQGDIALVPLEQVISDPDYQAIQELVLPDDVFSPVDGLTMLRSGVPDAAVVELCEAFDADAVMTVHIDFDWDFPTWNAAELKTRTHAFVLVPPDGHAVWKEDDSTWSETTVVLPSDLKRWLGSEVGSELTADGWREVINATAELEHSKWMGGALAYYLLEDAKAARAGG